MSKLDTLKQDYHSWIAALKTLDLARKAETKEFERLRKKLELHPELGNRDIITNELKRKIAETVLADD